MKEQVYYHHLDTVILWMRQLTDISDLLSPDRIYGIILGTCVVSNEKSATITAQISLHKKKD